MATDRRIANNGPILGILATCLAIAIFSYVNHVSAEESDSVALLSIPDTYEDMNEHLIVKREAGPSNQQAGENQQDQSNATDLKPDILIQPGPDNNHTICGMLYWNVSSIRLEVTLTSKAPGGSDQKGALIASLPHQKSKLNVICNATQMPDGKEDIRHSKVLQELTISFDDIVFDWKNTASSKSGKPFEGFNMTAKKVDLYFQIKINYGHGYWSFSNESGIRIQAADPEEFPYREYDSRLFNMTESDSIINLADPVNAVNAGYDVERPKQFSYSCAALALRAQKPTKMELAEEPDDRRNKGLPSLVAHLRLSRFQLQPFAPRCDRSQDFADWKDNVCADTTGKYPEGKGVPQFEESFDCMTWFTIPIWMGLLTLITLFTITASGVYLLNSLNVMDRFETTRSKPLQINVSGD